MDSDISCLNSSLLEYLPTVQGVWGSSPDWDNSVSGALAEDRHILGQDSLKITECLNLNVDTANIRLIENTG